VRGCKQLSEWGADVTKFQIHAAPRKCTRCDLRYVFG